MIDFLDNANKLMFKMEQLPLTQPASLLLSNLKYNLLPYPILSQVCQIIWKIPKIPVHVSNYTADNEDMCPCVKLYRSYLR